MARIAIATLQPVFDCRWSRQGHRLSGVADADQPESAWVCVREGIRRRLQADECETCPHWELETAVPAPDVVHAAVAPSPTAPPRRAQLMIAGTWLFACLSAMTLLVMGFVVLTSPLMLPLTVALWLTAAAVIGFACSGRLPGA